MSKVKVFHLSHCTTCKKILDNLQTDICEVHDIKENRITAKDLDAMAKITGSYESLFSRKALLYQKLGLKDKKLTEEDYRNFILMDYTFLKRPVVWKGKQVFAGHTKDAILGIKTLIGSKKS